MRWQARLYMQVGRIVMPLLNILFAATPALIAWLYLPWLAALVLSVVWLAISWRFRRRLAAKLPTWPLE